ncbi:MAG: hypothetical protein EA356_01370 [Geminicoccaceae bacterium]|nr:MAG: hypothetical protein EA356_01370 [Geminicoccaceae bacterium]
MMRFVIGAVSAVVLLASQAQAAAWLPYDPQAEPFPAAANVFGLPNQGDATVIQGIADRLAGGDSSKVTLLDRWEGDNSTLGLSVSFNAGSTTAGTWTFTADTDGKLPNAVVFKGGSGPSSTALVALYDDMFNIVFNNTDAASVMSVAFDLEALGLLNPGGNVPGLSYAAAAHVVPLPAAVLMFGTALVGLAGWRRYRS